MFKRKKLTEKKINPENNSIITEDDLKKTKNFLQSALKLGMHIEMLQERLEEAESLVLGGYAPSNLGTKISSSNFNSKENLYLTTKIMLESSINRRLWEFKKRFEEIDGYISSLEDVTAQLLFELRYLQGMKWDELEYEIGLSKRQLFRVHNKALPEMAKLLKGKNLI